MKELVTKPDTQHVSLAFDWRTVQTSFKPGYGMLGKMVGWLPTGLELGSGTKIRIAGVVGTIIICLSIGFVIGYAAAKIFP